MSAVTVLASGFKRPKRFDLAEHWMQSISELEGKRGRYPAVLAVAGGAEKKLKGWLAAKAVEAGEAEAMGDGWVTMRADFEHLEQACFVVLGLGTRVRVLKPLELRKAVEDEINGVFLQMNEEARISRP
jgi:hypothetical protein